MNKKISQILLTMGLLTLAAPAFATDLMDIYNQSAESDQVFQAAKYTRLANREALPQSIANLLPNLSATANTTYTKYDTVSERGFSPNSPFIGSLTPLGYLDYNSNGYTITLSQPIIAPINWMQVSAASSTAKQADATLGAAAQDLMIRVATAYFTVLQSQDNLRYTQAEKAAYGKQLDQEQQRFKVGLDAITSVYNAQASYDGAVASEIAAENSLRDSLEALRQLTGAFYPNIEGFKMGLPLLTPMPADVERWVAASDEQNLTLMAQRFAVLAARAQVKVNFSGHLPTLNAVGTYSNNAGQNFGTTTTHVTTGALQLNVPIFQGGLITSQTREAEDKYGTAAANMENTRRQVEVATRQQFNNVLSGISQVKADLQAIVSAQSSMDSTEESFKVGTRTIVDVLLAQNTFYQAKFNYARDEYTYLLSTLQLKQAAGTLTTSDLQIINSWLHAPAPQKKRHKEPSPNPSP